MKKLASLLFVLFSISCVTYVEDAPSAEYCEIDFVVTSYNGLILPWPLDDQVWYRDVVPCTKVVRYRQSYPIVHSYAWHGFYKSGYQYLRRIPRPLKRMKRPHRRHKSGSGFLISI